MQIVIEIPDERYKWIKDHKGKTDFQTTELLYRRIGNGIPLPKGHGRLIDENQIDAVELEDSITFMRYTKGGEVDLWIDAPTIIEADTESEDEE